jgi:hypothetical protein
MVLSTPRASLLITAAGFEPVVRFDFVMTGGGRFCMLV